MTKYAKSILDIACSPGNHMTAEQIFFSLKEQYPTIAMATIYNNLNMLYAQGLIRKISVEGYPDRYDCTKRHDHLVCRRCGELSDVFLWDFKDQFEEQLGFSIEAYDLKLFYTCKKCGEKFSKEQ